MILTGYPSLESATASIEHDVSAYIKKPFSIDEFREVLLRIAKEKGLVIDINRTQELSGALAGCEPREAASLLESESGETCARALEQMNPAQAIATLGRMPEASRRAALAAADPQWAAQWKRNASYEEDTIGRMMAPALAVMPPTLTIAEAVARLEHIVK